MVIPVDGRMLRVRSTPVGPEVERSGYYRFVPLIP
jgi:protein-L-isoaspartate(D-aspartate) O-methyltransferase